MDTKTLVAESKARFNHNSTKAYLRDKYDSKFIVAEQNGLWRANLETINFLNSTKDKEVVLIDNFNNPVKVDRKALLVKLQDTYTTVMNDWYNEWTELENNR
jgi:hypothetical protein